MMRSAGQATDSISTNDRSGPSSVLRPDYDRAPDLRHMAPAAVSAARSALRLAVRDDPRSAIAACARRRPALTSCPLSTDAPISTGRAAASKFSVLGSRRARLLRRLRHAAVLRDSRWLGQHHARLALTIPPHVKPVQQSDIDREDPVSSMACNRCQAIDPRKIPTAHAVARHRLLSASRPRHPNWPPEKASMTEHDKTGGCQCGAVRFRTRGSWTPPRSAIAACARRRSAASSRRWSPCRRKA